MNIKMNLNNEDKKILIQVGCKMWKEYINSLMILVPICFCFVYGFIMLVLFSSDILS
ncbi:hypothetical protein KTQ89_07130 [Holdemanella porci]|uniref:hypothetical protein n=1 Tax=Holdemanella porci TaxID=2652276 RepID=UPI001C2C7099|nr:hypothetical protein [Holdemanella porci]MBU9872126.1 hypothetical protein [Holdemanella porci]